MTRAIGHALGLLLTLTASGCGGAGETKASAESAPTDTSASTPSVAASESWARKHVAKIRVDTGDAGGMRGCTGTLTDEAKGFFAQVYAAAQKCGEASSGTVTFHSTLEEGGGLSEFSVLEDKVGDPKVIECVQGQALAVEYPKVDPKTPCVQLVHPLTFP